VAPTGEAGAFPPADGYGSRAYAAFDILLTPLRARPVPGPAHVGRVLRSDKLA